MKLTALDELIKECHSISVSKGWWEPDEMLTGDWRRDGPAKIALMHSELSEALEAMRVGSYIGKDSVTEELADTIIRIFDYAGAAGLLLADEILAKIERNRARPYRHGGKVF